jgi:hypothetical protein
LISNQLNQNQIDQQIEHNIDETNLNREKDQTFINDTNTIDLSTSSQKLEKLISRKRKTKEERQIALKKKIDSIKIFTLMPSIDEALKNAQKTLFERLKVAKTEHVIIQHLINQINKARANLDLTNEALVAIDQVQIEKNFEFVSIDLTKKSSSITTTYCETMSEIFNS